MDENDAGAMVATVSTENASEVTVDNDHFEVADGNLKLKDDSSLDFEAVEGGMIELTLTASGDGESATAMVTVTVNDVNEAPMITVVDGTTPDGMDATSTVDENVAGALLGEVTLSDPDAGQTHTLSTSDARFVTKQDAEGGWWLALADGVSLDHEAGATVTVTVTVTDDGDPAMSASTDVTITVNDVNEAPEAVGTVDAITTESGVVIKPNPIDLLALFNDPDAGDANAVRYELSGQPSWLTFSVEFGEDDDGNDTAHGIFSGTPPTSGPDSDAGHMVTLTATDSGGEEGSVSFYVIVDDGNDDVTDVDLIDDNGNVAVEADVDENDASGVVFGEIRVHDQDHAMHPNGMHLIQVLKGDTRSVAPNAPEDTRFEVKYDDAGIPWLVLKEGESLDFEDRTSPGAVEVTIRAVDMNGATNKPGTAFTGNVEFQTVSIVINNENDAPKAGTIGNWWVTAEGGQNADDVNKGSWLRFSLEDPDDAKPAFTDPDGDTLTYSLSGPSWLEINARTGEITNTKGGVPVRGNHRLTVTATDPDGESASAMFYLAVALSGDGTDATANNDNEAPRFGNPTEYDYDENSGEMRVATFTVRDDDNDLGHHPFALDTVTITQIVVDFRDSGTTDETIAVTPANQNAAYVSSFRLSEPRKSGDTWTYDLWVRDTNPSPRVDMTEILDYETINRITVTVTANDGTAAAVTEEIAVDIDDVNDRPKAEMIGDNPATPAAETTNIAGGTYGVNQSETLKEILYIKLEDIWTDQEDASDRLTFTASVSGSWVSILHGPAEWGDIEGVTWGDDDIGDTGTPNRTAVTIADDTDAPADGEQVLIIELDRTGRNNDQDAMGSFTITATDRDSGTGSMTYRVPVTDQNLTPTNAVTLSGAAREDATLRATFNDDRDPDLGGAATPALVLYQWFRVASDGTETVVSHSTSNAYQLKQADVGSSIRVKVKYYEIFGDQLVGNDLTRVDANSVAFESATTLRVVSNTPDKGVGSVTVLADANVLSVTDVNLRITDGDYSTPGGLVADSGLTGITVSWEISDNGRGGWEAVDQEGDTDTSTLELDDGKGKYYRAVVTYNANNDDDGDAATTEEMESVYSDAIQVSDVRDTAGTAPTITGNPFPGGTLSVDVRNTSVQWQRDADPTAGFDWVDIPGATGSLTLTQAHAGSIIRALVSYHSTDDDNPGVTAVVAVNANGGTAIAGTTAGTATPTGVDDHDIEVSVAAPGHPARGTSNNAGHNLSHEEIVPLASLFQDPDSARLTYTVTSVTGSPTNSGQGSTYVYDDVAGGVLTFEASTGKLTFNSDVYQGHDGTGTDGTLTEGNVITLTITATDEGSRTGTADVNLRINVAPTDIFFADSTGTAAGATNGSGTPETFSVSVEEHVAAEASARPAGQLIAHVNVQDQNEADHKFGTHEVTLSGDDRFMITHSGYTGLPTSKDSDNDGSNWEVRLKPGAKLDYEAENADMRPTIVLTLTATDGGGLSTPAAPITLTITVTDDASDNVTPTPNDVPGLEDNDSTDDNEVEDGDDTDTDGGTPPPPGMSLGGIIEDFVDNMHGFEQDLFEDFMLVIDDGIDIA